MFTLQKCFILKTNKLDFSTQISPEEKIRQTKSYVNVLTFQKNIK